MWSAHKKILFMLGTSLAAGAILAITGGFLYVTIQKESAVFKNAQSSIAVLDKKEQELIDARSSLDDMRGNTASIQGAFVSEDTFVNLLRLLEGIAREANVSFKAQDAQLPAGSNTRPTILMEVQGDYASIIMFVSLLDRLPYSGVVDRFTMSPMAGSSKLSASLDYTVFNFLPHP